MRKSSRRSNNKGRSRRSLRQGTTRALPFLQYLGRNQTAIINGLNTVNLTVATLASEMSATRVLKFLSVTVKFYPSTIYPAITESAQLQVVDLTTSIRVPVTSIKPLNETRQTLFKATLTPLSGWVFANSGATLLTILIYSTGADTLLFDVESRFLVAQDTLA